ncbi:glutamine amidotransferase [Tatumella morbirosei]|uniref:Glutamine amidotransferase n=1 Tax=Tatumella morbirosei TaxID=642227 RepID=A0A095UEV7_9GAMM|nr:glutamine amidotransferase [Tatumella morbirosei]KGD72978.1 glutamine amidotransferase [Tatumella morbirosei]
MSQTSFIIIQTGTPPEDIRQKYGDLPDWFSQAMGIPLQEIEVVRVFEGQPLPAPDPSRLAVITGSWAMVTEKLSWSELTAEWIRQAMAINMPLFGVCYGHQLMAYALGGEVRYLDCIRETGCLQVSLKEAARQDPLTGQLPEHFPAHLTHMQTVSRLPDGAIALASSAVDSHQIVRYGPNAVSTQFHPEFSVAAAKAMIERRSTELDNEGRDSQSLIAGVTQTPDASGLLTRFISMQLKNNAPIALSA